jgi:hypothetical protein
MTDETKNAWDLVLQIITMAGAAIAFWVGLRQWRRGQDWQRAEQMDKFVQQFENDDLLRLAATVIDWTRRQVKYRDREFVVTNTDALLALRDHTKMGEKPVFAGEQAVLRDAYDALLAFFSRLELALSTKLIDLPPAKQYFQYWLSHFLAFDRHPDEKHLLQGQSPDQMVKGYIQVYADIESIRRLCRLLDIKHSL